ncbi:glutathione S-transferase family protein [Noviherbaspirillum sp. 17J57-3]|uniref:Glutathione S-transferase family protein n=2 Tax=Noviherbaspirillum galbum TaxID=2709383 RepID=A0A6B3SQL7_9BURK|nr:glutathione S-transferase family protein [Noviherbaspirillum galbum]
MSGYLDHGKWRDGWYDTAPSKGQFVRTTSAFRHRIVPPDAAADGEERFIAEPGRYHLYVSLACPWAHRTLIVRALKKLEPVISVSVVEPVMTQGWSFSDALPDHLYRHQFLHQLYAQADPSYTGRILVPVLWDRKTSSIVNNESSEIIRMLNGAFEHWADRSVDLYPAALRGDIDEINSFTYEAINNGVYRCGFATTQEAYEEAYVRLFAALDDIERRLEGKDYLVGNRPTEADWRLFTTLIRFDAVYYSHFKCNRNRIADMPNLASYARRLYRVPGIAATVDMDHIKRHYFMSHPHINPTRIVPAGPATNYFDALD